MKKFILVICACVAGVTSLMAQNCADGDQSSHLSTKDLKKLMKRTEPTSHEAKYIECIKELMSKCKDSDSFAQQLITAYPTLPGAEGVKALAKSLYPDEKIDIEKEQVRARVQDYFNMVSNLDEEIAKGLWADRNDVSIITPRSHFVGRESIMNDFLIKTFSTMQSRKLHSLCEVINIYGDSANVQLYWVFDTIDSKGDAHQTKGRESLVFSRIDSEWCLVHVHYSRMPQ